MPAAPAISADLLSLSDKPSIVVLPFDNMSGDPEQEYFADGLTEDVITELSRSKELFVIARNTAFTYKGQNVDVPAVAKELGVHFVLEGSVRRAHQRVRITVQLIDGREGGHVWAERYDGMLEDVFDLQEEITSKVAASISSQIEFAEVDRMRKGERIFDEAHDLAWRALAGYWAALANADPPGLVAALELAEKAVGLNKSCAVAYNVLCFGYSMQSLFTWADPKAAADNAMYWANAAMTALPGSYTSYLNLGVARARKGKTEEAIRDFERALELVPNDVRALHNLGWCEATMGNADAARRHTQEALRLSPKDRLILMGYLNMAMAAFIERDHADFLNWGLKAIQVGPVAPIRRAMMIAHAAEIGDEELLKEHLDELNRFSPRFHR